MICDLNKTRCVKTFLKSVFALFVFTSIYNWLAHAHLLQADYTANAAAWRGDEEMRALSNWWPLYYLVMSVIMTGFFVKFRHGHVACSANPERAATSRHPLHSGGLNYGLLLGFLFGIPMMVGYLYMPISWPLAYKWFLAGLGQGIGAGIVLGYFCKVSYGVKAG